MKKLDYLQLWFTYGPQTKDDHVIRQLFEAGATGARLTFSYGTPELQCERAQQLLAIGKSIGLKPYLVADLQGEKCRFSKIEGTDEIPVQKDEPILLTGGETELTHKPLRVPIQISRYLDMFDVNDVIVEGDGALLLKVIRKDDSGVMCVPETDGVLHPGRGLLVRKPSFRPAPMSKKDESDIRAIDDAGLFDAIAVSFVGQAGDIKEARKLLLKHGSSMSIIAKIETQLGVHNLRAIANEADILMAARGDLALTTPWTSLYRQVSDISSMAAEMGRDWILATQLMEGLERFVIPTRAEICDLAHWVSEGATGVMLSYETAFGPRPIEAVKAASDILECYRLESANTV
jgi:pyruvate kinase